MNIGPTVRQHQIYRTAEEAFQAGYKEVITHLGGNYVRCPAANSPETYCFTCQNDWPDIRWWPQPGQTAIRMLTPQ